MPARPGVEADDALGRRIVDADQPGQLVPDLLVDARPLDVGLPDVARAAVRVQPDETPAAPGRCPYLAAWPSAPASVSSSALKPWSST